MGPTEMNRRHTARRHSRGGLGTLAERHAQALIFALGRVTTRPLGSLMLMAVIGIALSLPAALHVLVNNVTSVGYSWESSVQASLFLKDSVNADAGKSLAQQLAQRTDVRAAHFISRQQALQEFRRYSGFGSALKLLNGNPLPAVISVQPAPRLGTVRTHTLVQQLTALPQVARVQMDEAWLNRLHAIVRLLHRAGTIIAVLLGCAVIIVVGNSIRLDIQNQREAIEVMKMLGATDRFIRRPFLYAGIWYGLFGSIIGWVIVEGGLFALSGPVARLTALYHSTFQLSGLSGKGALWLLAAGVALGWLGSWWAVQRHLRDIHPS